MSTSILPVRQANDALIKTRNAMVRLRERASEQVEEVIETGSVAAAGFALGAADAKWGEDAIAGMSTSLAVGLGGTALTLFGVGGPMLRPILKGISHTGIGVYAYKSGFEMMRRRMTEDGAGS